MQVNIITAPYTRFRNEVGTQDLLKACALFIMIIDHLGIYFFPEERWMRAIGRGAFIIFFFFVGYNFKHKTTWLNHISVLAIIIASADYFFKGTIFPLNVLIAISFCRLGLHYYQLSLKNKGLNLFEWFVLAGFALISFTLTNSFFEYGFLGLLIAIWGYNLRKGNSQIMYTLTIMLIICL